MHFKTNKAYNLWNIRNQLKLNNLDVSSNKTEDARIIFNFSRGKTSEDNI
jgi:hypothetical protein